MQEGPRTVNYRRIFFLIWTTIFDNSVLKLLLYGPRFRINQSYPGNIGNLSLQHSPESWKYYPNPKPNPKPNPYPFLDPGRVIPGNAGGPGPGRRAGSRNPNPLGGYAPAEPPPCFFMDELGPASDFLATYSIIPHPASYVINIIFYQFSAPNRTSCRY